MRLALAIGIALICLPTGANAMTPAVMCKKAGFDSGHPFKEECVQRVFRERRSNFWRNEAPKLLIGGVVAGIAATGGTAFGVFTTRPEPGVYQVDVDGEHFLVRFTGQQATVRSTRMYKNVRAKDEAQWVRAVEKVTGCSTLQRVRDFDALYAWLDCAPVLSTPTAAVGPSPSTSPALSNASLADELAKLGVLREKGLLTAAEYKAAKAKLLKD